MSIFDVIPTLMLVLLGYAIWLLATTQGKEKMKTMPKWKVRFIFVCAGLVLVATLYQNLFSNLIDNPNIRGRRTNKPADIQQTVEIEGYEIEVINANFTKFTHTLQGSNTKYGTVSVGIYIRCHTTDESCPKGNFTLRLPEYGVVEQKNISLSSGEEEEIALTGHILSNSYSSKYSPASIKFHIENPIRNFYAYFQVEVD